MGPVSWAALLCLCVLAHTRAAPSNFSEPFEEEICRDFPCGANAFCVTLEAPSGRLPGCRCERLHDGDPYEECRPVECDENEQCPANQACVRNRCASPCRVCGRGAICEVYQHQALCSCPEGHVGDPSIRCAASAPHWIVSGSPVVAGCAGLCGPNSLCSRTGGAVVCDCAFGYFRDHGIGACRRGCRSNGDCPSGLVCSGIGLRCVEPLLLQLR